MITVLVTGPIGSGKSEACRYLESLGLPVYDCDSRCKRLYSEIPGLKSRIESELGIPFGELPRIFEDEVLRGRLESLVYPLLVEDLKEWKSGLDGRLAFVESAIALDKPAFDGLYDKVLLITACRSIRFRRSPKARERDSIQEFDLSRADYTIRNNRSREELFNKINDFIATLI